MMNTFKKTIPFIVIIILLLIIKNNISAISASLDNKNTAANLRKKLAEEHKRNTFLKERLYYVKTDDFVRDEAQQKLGLLQPGEYYVIAPTSIPKQLKSIEIDNRSNLQKWVDLFF